MGCGGQHTQAGDRHSHARTPQSRGIGVAASRTDIPRHQRVDDFAHALHTTRAGCKRFLTVTLPQDARSSNPDKRVWTPAVHSDVSSGIEQDLRVQCYCLTLSRSKNARDKNTIRKHEFSVHFRKRSVIRNVYNSKKLIMSYHSHEDEEGCQCVLHSSGVAQSLEVNFCLLFKFIIIIFFILILCVSMYKQEIEFERGICGAAVDGDVKRIEHLLSQHVSPNSRDRSGYTPLVSDMHESTYTTTSTCLYIQLTSLLAFS